MLRHSFEAPGLDPKYANCFVFRGRVKKAVFVARPLLLSPSAGFPFSEDLVKRLASLLAAVALAGCSPKGAEQPNAIDEYMEPKFEAESITPVEAPKAELCRRLAADLLGRFLTADEAASQCKGSVGDIARRFQGREEYLVVSERHWRDRLDTSDVNVDWRQLKDLYDGVDALHRGDLRYEDFGLEAMSHPGFVMNVFQPEDKVKAVFRAFLGRAPSEAEASDFAALYRPWIPTQEVDPDVAYIYTIGARIFPLLCDPVMNCSTTLFGGGALDLSSISDPGFQGVRYDDLSEAQKDALREPGRILTAQPFFYEAAADEILNRLLGWSDGGRFPREPGIVLPQVREILADYLRETGNYPAAERLVITSWLYRMKAEVADDGFGDSPTAPVPAIYATGPVKAATAEVWLDSTALLTLSLGACDARYEGFPYFLILQQLQNGAVTQAQATADMRKIYDMQQNRQPWDDEQGMPDFLYQSIARLIGGCPGFGSMRQEQTGLSYAFTQESLAELLCQPGVAQNVGTDTAIADIVQFQTRIAYGRDATAEEIADYTTAAASCADATECSPTGMRNAVCVGLTGGAPMIFY